MVSLLLSSPHLLGFNSQPDTLQVLSRSKTRSLSPGYAPPTKPITVRHHKCSTHKCEGKKKRSLKMVIDVSNEVARIGCSEYLHKNYMFVAGEYCRLCVGLDSPAARLGTDSG